MEAAAQHFDLELRISSLETRIRRQTRTITLLIALVAVAGGVGLTTAFIPQVAIAQNVPKVIIADELRVAKLIVAIPASPIAATIEAKPEKTSLRIGAATGGAEVFVSEKKLGAVFVGDTKSGPQMIGTTILESGSNLIATDSKGAVRLSAGVTTERESYIDLLDDAQRSVLRANSDESGPTLRLTDGAGRGAILSSILLGMPLVSLKDRSGKQNIQLTVGPDRDPSLTLTGENGKTMLGLGVAENSPMVSMHDENSNMRLGLGFSENKPFLMYFDKNKQRQAEFSGDSGSSLLRFYDSAKNIRCMLASGDKGSSLFCLSRAGAPQVGLVADQETTRLSLFYSDAVPQISLTATPIGSQCTMSQAGVFIWRVP